MPKYDVYVVCSQCGQPHTVNLALELEQEHLDRTILADYYGARPVPSAIAFMQTNKYRCPHTKQLFPADDISKAILFASS